MNCVTLNPEQRSHREKFVESIEEQLEGYQLENELPRIQTSSACQQIEAIDEMIMKILTTDTKKLEGIKQNMLFS